MLFQVAAKRHQNNAFLKLRCQTLASNVCISVARCVVVFVFAKGEWLCIVCFNFNVWFDIPFAVFACCCVYHYSCCLFEFVLVCVIAFVVEVVVCFVVGCVIIVGIGLCLGLIDVGGLLLFFFCTFVLGCPHCLGGAVLLLVLFLFIWFMSLDRVLM